MKIWIIWTIFVRSSGLNKFRNVQFRLNWTGLVVRIKEFFFRRNVHLYQFSFFLQIKNNDKTFLPILILGYSFFNCINFVFLKLSLLMPLFSYRCVMGIKVTKKLIFSNIFNIEKKTENKIFPNF